MKAELLRELDSEQENWEDLLRQIGEERMKEPGVAGFWSVKDIVAHISAWRRRTVGRLEAAARGEPDPTPPWPADLNEDDAINAWFYERDRDKSVAQVLSESREVFQKLRSAIEKLPQEVLDDPGRVSYFKGWTFTGPGLFSHFHDEHEADMRAFAARQPARS
jgi:hypothetical protein